MPTTSITSPEIASQEILDARSSEDIAVASPSAFPSPAFSGGLDFTQRADLIELMDLPCPYEELRACLHDIARVNRLTFAQRPTLGWLEDLVAAHPRSAAPLRVVDVGCGYGDTLRKIDRWAARRGVAVTLTGIDLNPDAIRAAREATPPSQQIEWLVGDALADHTQGPIDVVLCSLLTHHLTNAQIVLFLRWMEQTARRGWFIDDLHRKPGPYHLFRLWARFANWHRFVKNDGPVSIRRSFVVEDWQRLCSAAEIGVGNVSITEHRPARLCVGRVK
ncbi:methyltransferase domain-containing protein [Tunturibacter empetritectus]|uniref:SAM-dependent methyltransferase n=1 Tax=Tunturiibacter empetritectus TaxID=3069691 RepID=A0A7W8IKY6_9BACT|nr:methyltransferase domain-containing protein [Edaphobacter lichenicola]MBB5318210.1 SAM-dependent methyltransferase [Edaphobacter lichenicola]